MYGPGDNFDTITSHVIPALIRKIVDAKRQGKSSIEVWGDGTATREFLFVEDAAKGIVLAIFNYNKIDPINLGSGFEISIKDLVNKIVKLLSFKGQVIWQTDKPNGQPRRILDTTKALQEFGFKANTMFDIGLKKTINWYLKEGIKKHG